MGLGTSFLDSTKRDGFLLDNCTLTISVMQYRSPLVSSTSSGDSGGPAPRFSYIGSPRPLRTEQWIQSLWLERVGWKPWTWYGEKPVDVDGRVLWANSTQINLWDQVDGFREAGILRFQFLVQAFRLPISLQVKLRRQVNPGPQKTEEFLPEPWHKLWASVRNNIFRKKYMN